MEVGKLLKILRYRITWLFCRPWEIWGGITAMCLCGIALTTEGQTWLLITGYMIQSVGLVIAAGSILSNERLFALPRLRERMRSWWQERTHRIESAVVGGSATIVGSEMFAQSRKSPPENADIPHILESLWHNQKQIDSDLIDLKMVVFRENIQLRAALMRESRESQERLEQLRRTLASATVGSPITAYFGLLLALLGSALTTLGPLGA